jgi:hypothetical protein
MYPFRAAVNNHWVWEIVAGHPVRRFWRSAINGNKSTFSPLSMCIVIGHAGPDVRIWGAFQLPFKTSGLGI